ncbi:MAG: tyrosine-type recombinase/integrase [Ktedonobacterales bacterium]|nr:tyrosine-type recombinase/integrase [Ktedonobacterales bacterium]
MTDIIPSSDPLAILLHDWLIAKRGRTNSAATEDTYGPILAKLRTALQGNGLDLDSDPRAVAQFVERWVGVPQRISTTSVARSTQKQRLSAISSFYAYAIKHGWLTENPCKRIDYPRVEENAGAKPLATETVIRKLEAIDRTNIVGLRDLALLLVALKTGRRAAELASLSIGDIAPVGAKVMIRWSRTKGGKTKGDLVEQDASAALCLWLTARYGSEWETESPDAPVWVALEGRGALTGERLGYHGIRGIYGRRLGTTKVHTSRHTFAALLLKKATVQELQQRLGHGSLDTTARYMRKLDDGQEDSRTEIGDLITLAES